MRKDRERQVHRHYYPMYVTLDQRVCLVVGGGAVAERKVATLLQCGASVRVAAQSLTERLEAQARAGFVTFLGFDYEEAHLDDVDIVFAATDDAALNRRISEDARRRKLWCNMATDPELSTFIVPSSFQQGPLSIAVSTGGLSPALAKLIREKIEKQFGPEWVIFLELMGILRTAVQAKGLKSTENQRLFKEITALPIPDWIAEREQERILSAIYEICHPLFNFEELKQFWNEAWN